jgi:D-galactarolactone cycloisomerase
MKITAVEAIVVRLPLRHIGPPAGFGGQVWDRLATLLVRVETDAGLVGWGEAFGFGAVGATKAALDQLIAPLCVGRNAAGIAELMLELQRALHNFGRNGPVSFGLSGLDIALWDLAGKAAGLPLYRLLGGGPGAAREVEAYASLFRYGDPEAVGRVAVLAVERGYRAVKLHEVEVPPVAAARRAVGAGVALTLDTNCPWTVAEAVAMAGRLEEHGLAWLEEPVWPPEDHAGLAEVRRRARVPIAAGENAGSVAELRQLLQAGSVDVVQPSVTKIGGVSEVRRAMALAGASGVAAVPHSPYLGPGLLATLHLIAAAAPGEPLVERLFCDPDPGLFGGLTDPVDGRMRVPDGPGLGADPDPEVVARCRDG